MKDEELMRSIGLPLRHTPLRIDLNANCKKFLENMEYEGFDKWLLLAGAFGVGKTTIAMNIGIELVGKGYDVKYITLLDLVRLFKKGYTTNEDETGDYRECELLIIDELGIKELTKDEQSNIEGILNYRYSNGLNCILITNQKDFSLLGEMIRSRLTEVGILVALTNASYRRFTEFIPTKKRRSKHHQEQLESTYQFCFSLISGKDYYDYLELKKTDKRLLDDSDLEDKVLSLKEFLKKKGIKYE